MSLKLELEILPSLSSLLCPHYRVERDMRAKRAKNVKTSHDNEIRFKHELFRQAFEQRQEERMGENGISQQNIHIHFM